MTTHPDEPAFLDEDDPSAPLPSFISTTNAYELYGLREGETVAEAIIRNTSDKDVQLPLELPIWVSKRPIEPAEDLEWFDAEAAADLLQRGTKKACSDAVNQPRVLTPAELAELRQDMAESSAWVRGELARRRARKNE